VTIIDAIGPERPDSTTMANQTNRSKRLGSIEWFGKPDLSFLAESPKCVDAFYGQHMRALERADHERTKKAKMLPREVRPPWQGG
jgi:hypothetical protein